MLEQVQVMETAVEEQRAASVTSDKNHVQSLAVLRAEIEARDSAMMVLREQCDALAPKRSYRGPPTYQA